MTTFAASVTIVDLPVGTTVTGAEILEAVQTASGVGRSVQLSFNQIGAGLGVLPTGGATGTILNKSSASNFSTQFSAINTFVSVGTALATSGSATSIVIGIPNGGITSTQIANNAIGTNQIASSLGVASTLSVGTNFTVGGTETITGLATFNGGIIGNGTLSVIGNSVLTGTLGVAGNTLVTGTFGVVGTSQFTGAFNVIGTTGITGTTNITGVLGVAGTALFTSGNFGVVGTTNFTSGAFNVVGTTNVTGSLSVIGSASFSGGTFGVTATANLTGVINIVGTTTLTGVLGVNGTALFTSGAFGVVGTTQHTGVFNVVGTSIITGAVSVIGTTNITGSLVLGNLVTGFLIANATGVVSATTVAAGANFVLLNTLTPTNVASVVDVTSLTSTYSNFMVMFDNVCCSTANAGLQMLVATTGTSWITSSTAYISMAQVNVSSIVITDTTTNSVLLSGTRGTAVLQTSAAYGLNGFIKIMNPSNTATNQKFITGLASYLASGGGNLTTTLAGVTISGYVFNVPALTGMNFQFNSGNISTGIIKIYGIT